MGRKNASIRELARNLTAKRKRVTISGAGPLPVSEKGRMPDDCYNRRSGLRVS